MEAVKRVYGWLSKHNRLVLMIVVAGVVGAYQFWPLYIAIPALPSGNLQLVGVTHDGARYVVTDDREEKDGKLRTIILVIFDQLLKTNGLSIRFEAKREWINCAKKEIELEGAGFYDEQGRKVLTRYFDRKPTAVDPVDTEAPAVCENEHFQVRPVTGYQAALQQERAVQAEIARNAGR